MGKRQASVDVWCGVIWCSVVWCHMLWYGMV